MICFFGAKVWGVRLFYEVKILGVSKKKLDRNLFFLNPGSNTFNQNSPCSALLPFNSNAQQSASKCGTNYLRNGRKQFNFYMSNLFDLIFHHLVTNDQAEYVSESGIYRTSKSPGYGRI